jgi:hypothetical protein
MPIGIRLYGLVALAVAPLVFALLYNQGELREERLISVHRSAMEQAGHAAAEMRVMVNGMKNLLTAVSHMPEIRSGGGGCSAYMQTLHKAFPSTIAVGAADLSGNVYCLSRPMDRAINISDRYHFRAALETNAFAAGQHVQSRTMKVPSLPFAHPILDEAGRPAGVAFAVLSLSRLAEQMTSSHRSPGVNVLVVDRLGVLLADLPGLGRTGETIDDDWVPVITAAESQSTEITDPRTGKPAVVAFLPLQGEAKGMTVAVAIDKERALAGVSRLSSRDLGVIAAALLLALIAASLLFRFSPRGYLPPEAVDEGLRP